MKLTSNVELAACADKVRQKAISCDEGTGGLGDLALVTLVGVLLVAAVELLASAALLGSVVHGHAMSLVDDGEVLAGGSGDGGNESRDSKGEAHIGG